MENISFAEKYIAAFLKERLLKLSELKKNPLKFAEEVVSKIIFALFFSFNSLVTSFLKKLTNI